MAAKLVVVGVVMLLSISVVTYALYRYWDNQDERRHEKQMERERRDYDMLAGDSIDRELERERKR